MQSILLLPETEANDAKQKKILWKLTMQTEAKQKMAPALTQKTA